MAKMEIPVVSVHELHARLGFADPLDYPAESFYRPLSDWQMERDDAPIFRYLYRQFKPRRHLEFGTWQGTGVLYCLEECDATVWTINLPEGEDNPDGTWAYAASAAADAPAEGGSPRWYRTDTLGSIGRFYLERDQGKRVCQIYCDSRSWDIRGYPAGFFDTALIDGGHTEDVVTSDTLKAVELVRPGGLVLWHDFCPHPEVLAACVSPRGVIAAVRANWDWLSTQMDDLFWVEPSWILVGVRKRTAAGAVPEGTRNGPREEFLRRERDATLGALRTEEARHREAQRELTALRAELASTQETLRAVTHELDALKAFGPVALGVARRVHGAAMRHPRAAAALKWALRVRRRFRAAS